MSKNAPDLKRYMDRRLSIKLNGNRRVTGVLRGFDQFMNIVLDETNEEVTSAESNQIGMVVRGVVLYYASDVWRLIILFPRRWSEETVWFN